MPYLPILCVPSCCGERIHRGPHFRFSLQRKGDGVHLKLAYNEDTPAIWNQQGKYAVWRAISNFKKKSMKYQAEFDNFLLMALAAIHL